MSMEMNEELIKEAEEFLKNKDITKATCYTNNETYYIKDLFELLSECITNSKYVQKKIIEAQIEILQKYRNKLGGYDRLTGSIKQEMELNIYDLQQQLKQLDNE